MNKVIKDINCFNGQEEHKANIDLLCIDENCKDHILEPICSKCLDDKTVPNHGKVKKRHVSISINSAL